MPRSTDPMKFHRPSRRWRRFITDDPKSPYIVGAKKLGFGTDLSAAEAEKESRPLMLLWWAKNGPKTTEHIPRFDPPKAFFDADGVPMYRADHAFDVLEACGRGEIEPADIDRTLLAPLMKKRARKGLSIKDQIKVLCDTVEAEQKPATAQELDAELHRLTKLRDIGGDIMPLDADVQTVGTDTVRRIRAAIDALPLTKGVKKKRLGIFRRFVSHLVEEQFIPYVPNLKAKKYSFSLRGTAKKVKRHPLDKVREALAALPERQKCFVLCCLNFGMTAVDLARVEKGDVVGNILNRKRVKTEREENVPEVDYVIWPETMELLDKCKSDHDTLLLLCREGKPLVEWKKNTNGKWIKRDRAAAEYRECGPQILLKSFRSIGSTIVNDQFGKDIGKLYLGHAPGDIIDRNYAATPQEKLFKALDHLHTMIFPPAKDI